MLRFNHESAGEGFGFGDRYGADAKLRRSRFAASAGGTTALQTSNLALDSPSFPQLLPLPAHPIASLLI